ncbi:MAG: M20 family metallopeptidase [Clostridiaceae bacterium]|nr:M20 family metallopeptidase [Clostridiaceae bacterium]
MKQPLFESVNRRKDALLSMADFICDNPEVGLKEYKACVLLADYLRQNGFSVELGAGGLETAFRAVWKNGDGGPSIGFLCEYDALEGIGHGCGHHLQGPSILGAAIALRETLPKSLPCTLVVYGTPAEETEGGKIIMLENGCFQDINVALMMHASSTGTGVDLRTMALTTLTVTYRGRGAHAAIRPEQGRSALDALLLAFHGIECLREHVPDDVRMHYAVTDGGMPANAVPAHAAAQIIVRSYDRGELERVLARVQKVLDGAAMMTETSCETQRGRDLDNSIPVPALNALLLENARLAGAPKLAPPREKTGSTDFGNVCYRIPGACIRVSSDGDISASGHSKEAAAQGKSPENHAALLFGSRILAATAYDLIASPDSLRSVRADFESQKSPR